MKSQARARPRSAAGVQRCCMVLVMISWTSLSVSGTGWSSDFEPIRCPWRSSSAVCPMVGAIASLSPSWQAAPHRQAGNHLIPPLHTWRASSSGRWCRRQPRVVSRSFVQGLEQSCCWHSKGSSSRREASPVAWRARSYNHPRCIVSSSSSSLR